MTTQTTIQTIWNGTRDQADELCNILGRNCACGSDPKQPTPHCAPHAMLLEDQRALDGLLFARHIVQKLLQEEFGSSGSSTHLM
jgi:hypothetical protein